MAEVVVRASLPGGELPEVGTLISETMADLTEDPGPYLLAGLGLLVISMPIVMAFIFALYIGMFVVMFGLMIVGGGLSVAVGALLGEAFAAIGMLLTQLVTFGGTAAFLFLAGALLNVVLAPLNASLMRTIAEYQRGGVKPEFNAAFRLAAEDVGRVIGVSLITGTMSGVLILFCGLPALLVPIVFGFASGFVYLHRMRPFEAVRTALAHFRMHPGWHVQFGLLYVLLFMVANYVPVLGMMFMSSLWVRAYRTVFGDGDEPVLA